MSAHITLKPKFNPFILGNPACQAPPELKEKLDALFATGGLTQRFKKHPHISPMLDGWYIKGRHDPFSEETNFYRVRKAAKIQSLVDRYQLSDHVIVPKKYIYLSPQGRGYVVAEKLELTKEVAARSLVGKDVNSSNPRRSITPKQAEALTRFAFEAGLTDLSWPNLRFTPKGVVAIIDTEPRKREWMKGHLRGLWRWLNDKSIMRGAQAVLGTSKLKLSLDQKESVERVTSLENRYLKATLLKTGAKIAALLLTFCLASSLPLLASLLIRVALCAKLCFLGCDCFMLYRVVRLGRLEGGAHVGKLVELEKEGVF